MKTLNINSNLFKTKHRNFKKNQFLQIIFTVIPRNHVNGIISIISEVHLLFQCVDYLMVFNSSQTGVMYSLWGHSVLVVSRKINIQEPKQEYGIERDKDLPVVTQQSNTEARSGWRGKPRQEGFLWSEKSENDLQNSRSTALDYLASRGPITYLTSEPALVCRSRELGEGSKYD